jgi:putative ABC transport system permease protein
MRDDLKNAIRSLRNSPSFTTVALVVLTLGIGASTAIFSVVDAVVLRGLPFDEHDRLAVVLEIDTRHPVTFGGGTTTAQTYLDWRRLQESFEGLAAVGATTFRLKNESGEPADARVQRVTWELFPTLRVMPMLGRAFTVDDEIDGRHRVPILSYGFWLSRFGGAPDAIGKTIPLNEESWEIVGVMPRGFAYPVGSERPAEIYAPLAFQPEDKTRGNSHNYNWTVLGRLKPGISLQQAHEQMNRVAAALDEQYPKWSPGRRVRVITLHEHIVGRVKGWMLILLGAVALVLLIACANVANLMLARASVRSREMAIRAAIGASRWRLVRGLLVEGVLLSLIGAGLGLLLAYAGVHVIRAWLPAGLPRVASIGIDLRVLGSAVAASGITGILFSMVPAVQSSRPDLTSPLKESGRSSTAGVGGQRLRSALVILEVALAVVLLVGAGLFIGSFTKLMRIDPGFDYHNLITFNIGVRIDPRTLADARTRGDAAARQIFAEAARRAIPYTQQMLDAVSRVPGVELAGLVTGGVPLTGNWSRTDIKLPGRPELKGDDGSIDQRRVSADYLAVLRLPLRRGRYLTSQDREGAPAVVVINEAAARKYCPGFDALGQRVIINDHERTVVGIVGDIRHLGLETAPREEAYVPFVQEPGSGASLVIRTTADPMTVLPAVKTAVWSVNREQRLTGDLVTIEGYMDRLIAQRRFNMALLVVFGVLGLVIAAVGIYGVLAYVVAQRTNEIGVRMALGATPGNVVAIVLKRAAILIGVGLGIGGAGAWYISAGVKTFLFETESNDPLVFASALAILACAGLAASAIPARRASAVDPLVALRQE